MLARHGRTDLEPSTDVVTGNLGIVILRIDLDRHLKVTERFDETFLRPEHQT